MASERTWHLYGKVSRKIWADEKFRALNDDAKLLFLRLLTGTDSTNVPGIVVAYDVSLARSLGWDFERTRSAVDALKNAGMVLEDAGAGVFRLPNAVKHNAPTSPTVIKGWAKTWLDLPESPLVIDAYIALRDFVNGQPDPKPNKDGKLPARNSDTFAAAFQTVEFNGQTIDSLASTRATGRPMGLLTGGTTGGVSPVPKPLPEPVAPPVQDQDQDQDQEDPPIAPQGDLGFDSSVNGSVKGEGKPAKDKHRPAAASKKMQEVYDHWRKVCGPIFDPAGDSGFNSKRQQKIRASLKHSTVDELKLACDGAVLDDWAVNNLALSIESVFGKRLEVNIALARRGVRKPNKSAPCRPQGHYVQDSGTNQWSDELDESEAP